MAALAGRENKNKTQKFKMPMKTNHIIRVSYELSDWDHFYLAHYPMGSNGPWSASKRTRETNYKRDSSFMGSVVVPKTCFGAI